MKILLVDDHALFRAGLRMLLATLDRSIEILEAATLAQAITLATAHPDLQLCLLDLSLRDEYGLRALSQIRAAAPEVAVVVVSGAEEVSTVRACIDAGAMSYIPKSAPPDVLTQAMRQVLAGSIFLPDGLLTDASLTQATRPVLTPRQRDVLRGLSRGLPTKSISRELALSEHTVKVHIAAVFHILGAHNRTEAVIKASRIDLRLDPRGRAACDILSRPG